MSLTLATTSQLKTKLQNSALDDTVAQRAIDDASALVRGISGQVYDYVQNETIEIRGRGHEIVLPQRPLVVDSTHLVTVQELRFNLLFSPNLLEGYNYFRIGSVLRRYYRTWAEVVKVTYTHGYQTVPDWLNNLVLDAAVMYATNPQGLRSESVGGITQVWARESVTNATDTVADMVKSRLNMLGELSAAFMVRPTQ